MVQFEVLRLATRSRQTGIHIQAIASRSREIAADIPATGMDSRGVGIYIEEIGIYWAEIATYIQEIAADIEEMAANIGEIRIYTRRPTARSRRMAANSPFPLISRLICRKYVRLPVKTSWKCSPLFCAMKASRGARAHFLALSSTILISSGVRP